MKTFKKHEIQAIKRVAQNVAPIVAKRLKIVEQIKALKSEYDALTEQQELHEAPIRILTGGFTTEDLVERIVEPTGSVDKNGKAIKVAKFVLKYPETIIPEVPTNVSEEEVESELNEEPIVVGQE